VDVGERPDLLGLALGLLGGHVAGRAHDRVGPRQAAVRGQRLGQAEIGELGRAVGCQQNVARLQVAVDNAQTVCLGDAARERFDQLGRLPRRPGLAAQPPVQTAAGDVLQLEERQAVGLADVVDLHDIGVLQAGDGLRLGQEASYALGTGMGTAQDHLEDAEAIKAHLAGAVDDAHPTAAELAHDFITGDGGDGAVGHLQRGAGVCHGNDRRTGPLGGSDGRLSPGALETVFVGSPEGYDAVAGGCDDRLIEKAVGPVVSQEERLDPLPQLRIAGALSIQDGGTGRGLVAFDGRQEHGLNTIRVERHRVVLGLGLRVPAPGAVVLLILPEKRLSRRARHRARPGHKSISGERGRR